MLPSSGWNNKASSCPCHKHQTASSYCFYPLSVYVLSFPPQLCPHYQTLNFFQTLLPHQMSNQTSSEQSRNATRRLCRCSDLLPPLGGSRPSSIHQPRRTGPTCKCVLLCSLDLMNDICIKLLSPCAWKILREGHILSSCSLCDIFQIEYVNSDILFFNG